MADALGREGAQSLVGAAAQVLRTADPMAKAALTQDIVRRWREGSMPIRPVEVGCMAPDQPARTEVRLVPPGKAGSLGKGRSPASRLAIVHRLCHIERWAMDLAWDVIARWGAHPDWGPWLPREFFDDFVTVASDECRHFLALEIRLVQGYNSHYGALVAHDGLWESASATKHSLAARLAVEHCVHEARGLDVLPTTIAKFRDNGDEETAALLEGTIYPEEVTHCAAGVRWLRHLYAIAQGPLNVEAPAWLAEARQFVTVEAWFQSLVRAHFYGYLKPPFNDVARSQAGFTPSWYEPLAQPD